MNADQRRWVSLGSLLFGVCLATPARSAEIKSELSDDIDQRFEESTIEVSDLPIEFGCEFSKYVASRKYLGRTSGVNCLLIMSREGSKHLEEPASLPQPTLIETYIAEGFPSGNREQVKEAVHDDSYHLAPDYRSYRGVTMLFDDERLLAAGQTFYR
jgi:hypothetical protein